MSYIYIYCNRNSAMLANQHWHMQRKLMKPYYMRSEVWITGQQ